MVSQRQYWMINIKLVNEEVSVKIHACFHGTVGTRECPQSDSIVLE